MTLRCVFSLPLKTSRSTSSPMLHLSSSLYKSVPVLQHTRILNESPNDTTLLHSVKADYIRSRDGAQGQRGKERFLT